MLYNIIREYNRVQMRLIKGYHDDTTEVYNTYIHTFENEYRYSYNILHTYIYRYIHCELF